MINPIMAIPSSFLSSLLLFFLLIFFTYQSNAVYDEQEKFHYFCDHDNNRGNFTTNSTYHTNLNTLLSTLTNNTEITYGFYNSSYGQSPDKVNAIALCRGDLSSYNCTNCLNGSKSNLTRLCPNRKEAIFWFENERCMLRYSDRSIFNQMEDVPMFSSKNKNDSVDVDLSNQVVTSLLQKLTETAAAGDGRRKYAASSEPGPQYEIIYGLVQCTPDLTVAACNSCLVESLEQIQGCCKNKIGGRVVRPSCNMRFETSHLFYEPSPPSPSPPPPPQLSPPPPSTNNTSSSPGNKSNINITVIAIAVPVTAVIVLIFLCIYLRVRKQRKRFETQEEEYEDDEIEILESLQFTFDTIRDATDDFSDSNKLGHGGFGTVYRGRLYDGQDIAVKRLSKDSGQGDIEFKNEVLLVAKLQHRNLVRLLGFCLQGRERLLVYEFVENKSLDYFIFDQTKRAQLNWKKRYKIIAGIARGILYLHEDSRLRIIHRDLKASNILLDEEMSPKIADFGMARLFDVDQTQENTNRIVGTRGYMAPEYVMDGQFSVKSDVFSFGVLVLEIISGRKNSGVPHGSIVEYLLGFVWRNWKDGSATNIIDDTLKNDSVNEIIRCIHIGLLCVQKNAASRPTMASIVLMLSSHSAALSVPSEPAFYVDSGTQNRHDMQSWQYSSTQESINEASITDPYPR